MSARWYYSQDGAQYGPVGEKEIVDFIQSGDLPPGTPVCKKDTKDWKPARDHACFRVEIYPKRKARVKATASTTSTPASGETSQPARQTGAQPVIASSSPAHSLPPVTDPNCPGLFNDQGVRKLDLAGWWLRVRHRLKLSF